MTDTEKFDLGEQLRQCAIITSRSWMEKEQSFTSDLPETPFTGNRELLQHLWLNLINNAIKYTPRGGEIALSVRVERGQAVVCVTDNGEGMNEETQKHLFDPYFQGDSSRSVQGLGLGLAISKRIVELCQGEIAVESKLGEGSTFTVRMPIK